MLDYKSRQAGTLRKLDCHFCYHLESRCTLFSVIGAPMSFEYVSSLLFLTSGNPFSVHRTTKSKQRSLCQRCSLSGFFVEFDAFLVTH